MNLHVSREVAAPAQHVWDTVTDLDATPTILSGVDRIERLDADEGFGVGTRWRETRTMFGKQATEEMEVTDLVPPHRYTAVARNSSTTYTSTITVDPLGDDRCRLGMSFAASTSSTAGRLLAATVGRLFQGATRKALRRDLDDIASHAEASQTG